MPLREKLTQKVQPFLEPGEQVRHVFLCQTGPSPYWSFATYLVAFAVKMHAVAVTNQNIVFLRAGLFSPSSPKEVEKRFPRNTRLGPLSGLWGKMELDGQKYWVHKRFHKDVAAADAEVQEVA